jgi:hypothetical protein
MSLQLPLSLSLVPFIYIFTRIRLKKKKKEIMRSANISPPNYLREELCRWGRYFSSITIS